MNDDEIKDEGEDFVPKRKSPLEDIFGEAEGVENPEEVEEEEKGDADDEEEEEDDY